MAAPSGITFREVNDVDIPLPAPGKFTVYGRGSLPRVKDSMGNIFVLGNGIVSIAFVNTVGLVDNYLITLQDGTEVPFTVTNAKSITTIAKVGTTGLVDTYRISFNNGAPVDFTVTNARSIVDIQPPANPGQPGATDTYQIVFNDGPNDTFIVYNGTNGMDGAGIPTMVVASPVGNTGSAGTAGPEYANPDHVHAHGNQTNPAHHAVATTADNGFMSSTDKVKLDGIAAGAEVNQNAFSVITGNTGTATADAKTDSLAITGVNGLTTTATDTPDGLQISPTYGSPTGLAPDGANAAGTVNTFARSDHVHATPADTAVGLNGGSANGEGTSTSFSRADHTHAIANGGTPSTITPDAAANQGASTSLARSDHTHAIAADVPVALGAANAEGTSNSFARADHVHLNPVIAHEAAVDPHPQYTTTAEAQAAASAAVTAHEQAADPHPQYTTAAEAAAAAPVQSVNGQTGNVTVAAGTNNAAVTRTAPTASASTALTTIQSYPVAAGEVAAGSEYEFTASLRVINTTTATNAVITLSVGATNVLVLTQAIGTTAAAAPGAAVLIYGKITFLSTTQAECVIQATKSQAVAFNIVLNTSAPITVSAAGATTIDLKFNTSGATSTFIARQATIQRVK